MKKVVLKRLSSIVISLSLAVSIILPFSFSKKISATSITGTSAILGINVSYIDYDTDNEYKINSVTEVYNTERCQSFNSSGVCLVYVDDDGSGSSVHQKYNFSLASTVLATNVVYKYDIVFNDFYTGYIDLTSSLIGSIQTRYYVNGAHLELSSTTYYSSLTVNGYNLTPTHQYLLNFPMESFNVVLSAYNNLTPTSFFNYGEWTYPSFILNSGDVLGTFYWYKDVPLRLICICPLNVKTDAAFDTYFTISNSAIDFYYGDTINYVRVGSLTYRLCYIDTIQTTSDTQIRADFKYTGSLTDVFYCPVYFGNIDNDNVSTDFALLFGLNNKYLKMIEEIAYGNNSSNISTDNNDQVTSDLDSSSSDLFIAEDNFNNSMNTNLNQINTDLNISSWGSSFLASAGWVRDQFNFMTTSSPFGSVLSFSLLLGLALLLIGRVLNK